jgi:hypothetical protein
MNRPKDKTGHFRFELILDAVIIQLNLYPLPNPARRWWQLHKPRYTGGRIVPNRQIRGTPYGRHSPWVWSGTENDPDQIFRRFTEHVQSMRKARR